MFLNYRPSQIAAAAVIIAMNVNQRPVPLEENDEENFCDDDKDLIQFRMDMWDKA